MILWGMLIQQRNVGYWTLRIDVFKFTRVNWAPARRHPVVLWRASYTSLAVLFYRHPDLALASRWSYHASAMGIHVSTAPCESYAIFPTNHRVAGMNKGLHACRAADFGDKRNKEVDELLKEWRRRHNERIVAPVGAFLVSIWNVIAKYYSFWLEGNDGLELTWVYSVWTHTWS